MLITDEEMRAQYYNHHDAEGSKKNYPRWRLGARVVKFPNDLILYAQVIFDYKPDWIVECGTAWGGSACFFGDMLFLNGGKGVISIDVKDRNPPKHPMVEYVISSSTDLPMFRKLRSRLRGSGNVMVVLDSDHSTEHVSKELEYYSQLVTPGQFLVVEDCWTRRERPYFPKKALDDFLASREDFELTALEDQFIFAVTRGGWLRKKK